MKIIYVIVISYTITNKSIILINYLFSTATDRRLDPPPSKRCDDAIFACL